MATARCLATIPFSTLFTLDNVSKAKLTSVTIDNQGVGKNTIILQDGFTTDATVGAVAAPVTKVLKQVTVNPGLTGILSEKELGDVEVIGALQCLASVADPLCVITVAYKEI